MLRGTLANRTAFGPRKEAQGPSERKTRAVHRVPHRSSSRRRLTAAAAPTSLVYAPSEPHHLRCRSASSPSPAVPSRRTVPSPASTTPDPTPSPTSVPPAPTHRRRWLHRLPLLDATGPVHAGTSRRLEPSAGRQEKCCPASSNPGDLFSPSSVLDNEGINR
ncbi:hypothetical protein BS78_K094900 [Paspalum vaginatum]|uniref:Uncharacterized protein n=1 Tax=Paspalum vaginatum TaxID=158149 RepID=A0A9W7X9V1_9POAL|nr:hypothetical protein BS78_K094900 [Paspalum vaginatum]KAJ1256051.1 hypothetical protein BS78_K094900 [Paspalum vaginatum]